MLSSCEKLLNLTQRWLTIKEACMYAKMSKNTLMECIKSGAIKASRRRPKKIIIDRLSIDKFYESDIEDILFEDIAKRASL